jgi:cytochrome c peroxidase
MWLRTTVLALAGLALAGAGAPSWRWHLPQGVAPPVVPAENPMSAAKVELGRRLFYDADLSIDGTMSCATCHEQKHGFTDGNRAHPGVHGDPGRRNIPGLANVAWRRVLTWADPGMRTLEAQAATPIAGDKPVEMGMKGAEGELPRRLGRDACYRRMFAAAFPEEDGRIDIGTVSAALAAFQRTLISLDAPYDRWRAGNGQALSAAAVTGEPLFRAHCATCHSGSDLTDDAFHAIDAGPPDPRDRGLGERTRDPADDGKFRTPSLRNVAVGAPYFHDGATPGLREAVRRHRGVTLTDPEIAALIAFMGALTDEAFLKDRRFAYPDRACGRKL